MDGGQNGAHHRAGDGNLGQLEGDGAGVAHDAGERRWAVSPSLAGAAIYSGGMLSAFALIPFTPTLLPVPFGLIFGFFVLDAVVVRL